MIKIPHMWLFSSLALLVSCAPTPEDFDLRLVAGYYLFRTSAEMIDIEHVSDSRHPGVAPKVVAIGWNERFILAKRQPLKARGEFPGDQYQVPVPGKFDFWIIDVVHTNRYGPLTEGEFHDKLRELDILPLELKDVSKLKLR